MSNSKTDNPVVHHLKVSFLPGVDVATGLCPFCGRHHSHEISRVAHTRPLGFRTSPCDPPRLYLLVQESD